MTTAGTPAWIFLFLALLLPVSPQPATAGTAEREVLIPAEIGRELDGLLALVGPRPTVVPDFRPATLAKTLEFLAASKQPGVLYHPSDGPGGIPAAYFEVDIHRNLEQILRLTDNPDVPAVFTAPSTVRTTHWKRIDTRDRKLPRLWEELSNVHSPVMFTGIEHLVNTPDQTTGAYYEYDLHRSVILTRIDGHNVLISLSKQIGPSSVGRKGMSVGDDDQWDYLYTGQSGLKLPGLGWVNSYIYNSYSVSFYREEANGGRVRFGVFKWLKAGWADFNMVKRPHIYHGLKRFAEALKQIVEHRRLGDASVWSETLREIRRLGPEQLKPIVREYLASIRREAERQKFSAAGEVKTLLKDDSYMKSLSPEDMQSIVTVEYLKELLGKQPRIDVAHMLPAGAL